VKITIKYLALMTFAFFPVVFAFAREGDEMQLEAEDTKPSSELGLVVKNLQQNYESIKTYRAEFEQEVFSLNRGKVISRGAGKVLYKDPGKMAWRYQEPEEHLYVTMGDTIWDYSPAEKTAYVMPVENALYKSFLLGLGDIEKDFEVSFHAGTPRNREGNFQVDLVPRDKTEREAVGRITLYIDPQSSMVVSTEMKDALGNVNRIKFKKVETNVEIKDRAFRFKPPPGTRVIEAGEMMDK